MQDYVDKIPNVNGGFFKVVQKPEPVVSGIVDLSKPRAGVWHTTESSSFPSYRVNTAPHLTADTSTLYQHIPFGHMANALRNASGGIETNRWAVVQVEIVGFSNLAPWIPTSSMQRDIIASISEFAEKELGVPENHVYHDALKAGTVWATETNPRRLDGKFGKVPGWYYHLEVPENDHWDCGAMQYKTMAAQEPVSEFHYRWTYKSVWDAGVHNDSKQLTKPLTLKELGRALFMTPSLRRVIRQEKTAGHRIVLARQKVKI